MYPPNWDTWEQKECLILFITKLIHTYQQWLLQPLPTVWSTHFSTFLYSFCRNYLQILNESSVRSIFDKYLLIVCGLPFHSLLIAQLSEFLNFNVAQFVNCFLHSKSIISSLSLLVKSRSPEFSFHQSRGTIFIFTTHKKQQQEQCCNYLLLML